MGSRLKKIFQSKTKRFAAEIMDVYYEAAILIAWLITQSIIEYFKVNAQLKDMTLITFEVLDSLSGFAFLLLALKKTLKRIGISPRIIKKFLGRIANFFNNEKEKRRY